MVDLLIKGVIAGLIVASPTGPVSIRAIQKTVNNGKKAGFSAGMGIVAANLIFALVVTVGFAHISVILKKYDFRFQILNIIFLSAFFLVNLKKMKNAQTIENVSKHRISFKKEFKKSLLLCLSNPSTLISFLIIFNILQISLDPHSSGSLISLLAGLFVGAFSWWSALTFYIGKKEDFITLDFKQKTQKISLVLIFLLLSFTVFNFVESYKLLSFIPA